MFIFARSLGIFIYFFSSLFFLMLVSKIKKSQLKLIVSLYLFTLTVMAYFYEPYLTSDLYRIRVYVRNYAMMSWSEFFIAMRYSSSDLSSTPVAMLYYRLIGFLKNDGMIAAISCLIVYGIIFYMIIDYKERMKISNKVFSLVLFWLISMDYFMPVIATIRSYLAATLVVLSIYRENIKNKFGIINIFLYTMAFFLHSLGVGLVLFRLFCYFLQKGASIYIKIIRFIIILISIFVMIYFRSFIETSVIKAINYIKNDIYSYVWEWLLCLIQTGIFFIIIKRAKKLELFQKIPVLKKYEKICGLSELLLIVFNISFAFLQRFCFFVNILYLPISMQLLEANMRMNTKQINKIIFYLSIVVYALTCSRGYLCSLKFW